MNAPCRADFVGVNRDNVALPSGQADFELEEIIMMVKSGLAVAGAAEVAAQAQDGLRVDLANARLRQAEDLGDLGETHFLKVVHG